MYDAIYSARMRDTFMAMLAMNEIVDDLGDEDVRQRFYVQRDGFLAALRAGEDSTAQETGLRELYESLR